MKLLAALSFLIPFLAQAAGPAFLEQFPEEQRKTVEALVKLRPEIEFTNYSGLSCEARSATSASCTYIFRIFHCDGPEESTFGSSAYTFTAETGAKGEVTILNIQLEGGSCAN